MTEWTELKDMFAVAQAQNDGWEIEVNHASDWELWGQGTWHKTSRYRGRPKQPKKVTVTSKCWRYAANGNLCWRDPKSDDPLSTTEWQRFPAGDFIGEVEE